MLLMSLTKPSNLINKADTCTYEYAYKLIKNKLRSNGDSYTVKTNSLKSVGTVMNDNRHVINMQQLYCSSSIKMYRITYPLYIKFSILQFHCV